MAEPVVVENGNVEPQLAAEAPTENGNAKHEEPEQPATEPEPVSKGLYFVRIPRPTFDESAIKKLDLQLSETYTKLKSMNNKAQTKRGEANELRKQLTLARSLRSGSSPEFDEKMTRIRQLREMRKEFLDKIQAVKAIRSGLECRTEEELDEKVAEMENSIAHDGLSLRVEKQTVQNISKLKSQREKIREFQGQQESLSQWEAEAKKIKAVIDEVDSEINILRGERDQAKDIIDDLQKKLQAVTAVLSDYDVERQDIESTKRELQEQIKGMREEIDAGMAEYRANRKLSLQLRDLVTAGKVDEATQIAQEQVETYVVKLNTDKAYRKEYVKLWSEQRKYLVSELLPKSGNVPDAPAAKPGAKGKGSAAKPAERLVPQGAAKAQAIIAAALQEAELAVAAKRLAEPQPQHEEEPSEEVEEAGERESSPEPAVRVVPGATEELSALPKHKSHKASHHEYAKLMGETPEVPDYEYIMPVLAKKTPEQLSAEELKAKVREEQRQKAAEAEARKKRRQEQLAKKQAAAAVAKQQKAATEQQQLSQQRVAAPAARAAEIEGASGTDGEGEDAGEALHVSSTVTQRPAGKKYLPAKAQQQLAAAKKPLKKPVKVQKWYQQYATQLAVGGFGAVLLILLILAFTTK